MISPPVPSLTAEIERCLSAGDTAAAAAVARVALCEPRLHLEGLVWDALIALKAGRPRAALRSIRRATWLSPRRGELHALLGAVCMALDEHRLAARSYRRSLEREPRDVNVRINYLRALQALGDPEAVVQARHLLAKSGPEVPAPALRVLLQAGAGPVGRCRLEDGLIDIRTWGPARGRGVDLLWSGGRTTLFPSAALPGPAGAAEEDGPAVATHPWPEGAQTVRVVAAGSGEELPGSPLRRPLSTLPAGARPDATPAEAMIDVIVPVYKGHEATVDCLSSLLAGTDPGMAEIVVIDDASPDEGIRRLVDRLAGEGRITLLRNPENLGFLKTVNLGLRLHPGRDCVLLNADTVVGPGWLDRLRRAAGRADGIGTITPLSNNGEMMSFPRRAEANPMPSRERVALIDRLAASVNAGQVVDVPVGVGFCLYVRRACLDEIGLLDEESYDRGYGEEGDLCLRAAAAGWRNVCVTDVYVGHVGTLSFGSEKRELVLRNLDVLKARYPDYVASVERFVREDPLLPHRRRLERALLRRQSEAVVLVAGSAGRDEPSLAALRFRQAARGCAVFWLRPEHGPEGPRVWLDGDGAGEPDNLFYRIPEDLPLLEEDLLRLGVARVEFHDTALQDQAILSLPRRLGIPYAVVPHDFALLCPRRFMVDAVGRPCGGPQDDDACGRCVGGPGPSSGHPADLGAHRAWARGFLAGAAERRIASVGAARLFASRFPEAPFAVDPAPLPPLSPQPAARRLPGAGVTVAVVDGEDAAGGFHRLLAMARQAAADDLPLDFVVLGSTIDDLALIRTGRVSVCGTVGTGDLADVARACGCGVAATLAAWFEVDAPGVDRALATGLPMVAFGIGSTAERLRTLPDALCLDPAGGAAETNRALLARAHAWGGGDGRG